MRSRRLTAKLIDLLAFAGLVSLSQRLGGSLWVSFAVGAVYYCLEDVRELT